MPRLLEHHPPCWIYRLLNFVPDTRTTDDPRQAFFRAANSLLDRVPCSPPSSITEDSRLNSPLEFNPVRGLSRLKKYRKKRGVEYIYIKRNKKIKRGGWRRWTMNEQGSFFVILAKGNFQIVVSSGVCRRSCEKNRKNRRASRISGSFALPYPWSVRPLFLKISNCNETEE